MIQQQILKIKGNKFVKTYSDEGYYIERDGVMYSEAIDPIDYNRVYFETDLKIEREVE